MLYNGTTVAFSTKANVWKTRYSFTPTCYMTMSNDFMSSNLTGTIANNDLNIAWKHDVNNTYNRFYDQDYPSSLEVVSNDNPSAVKIFKSLSIESNTTNWTGSVYTNKDRGMTALQEGDFAVDPITLLAFTEKEGNQYSAMPRSRINSTSQIVFVGSIISANLVPSTASETTGLGEGYYPEVPANVPDLTGATIYDDGSYEVPLINVPQTSINFGSPQEPQVALFSEFLSSLDASGNQVQLGPDNNFPAINSTGSSSQPGIYITGYNSEYNTIRVLPSSVSVSNLTENQMTAFQATLSGPEIPVYILTDSTVNGDVMRGPYAGVNLTLNNASQPFELFAINVDYEKTKLDGSLG